MVPPAPPRFSMMICCPNCAATGSATMRPMMSIVLPMEKGTTARMVLTGQFCAKTSPGMASSVRTALDNPVARERMGMAPSRFEKPLSTARALRRGGDYPPCRQRCQASHQSSFSNQQRIRLLPTRSHPTMKLHILAAGLTIPSAKSRIQKPSRRPHGHHVDTQREEFRNSLHPVCRYQRQHGAV